MGYEGNLKVVPGLVATGDLSAAQYRFGVIGSSGVSQASVSGNPVDGVIQDKPEAANRAVSLAYSGVSKVVASGAIAAGTRIQADANGKAVAAAAAASAASKACSAETYNLADGDTLVLDTDNAGNETITFNAAAASILDTSIYTGGVAASITDTTVYTGGTAAFMTENYAHGADQVGLTFSVVVVDAINGTVTTVVTIAAACTTAVQLAAEIAAQVPAILTSVSGGHVVMTTVEIGLDVAISVTPGTSAVTWVAGTAGTGGLANQEGLTAVVTLTDAINGAVITTVSFTATSGFVTELSQIVDQINDQVAGVTAEGSTGQVIVTSDAGGVDVAIAIGAGTGGLTWAAAVAGTGGLANQEGLTAVVTLTGGDFTAVVQTVTFTATSGFVTELSQILAQLNAQVKGASFANSAGQVLGTHDDLGTGMAIAIGAGSGGLTWAAATPGSGDAVDASVVTAIELETLIEGDSIAEVVVSSGVPTITSPTLGVNSELDFISGTLLAKLGLSVETISGAASGTYYAGRALEAASTDGDLIAVLLQNGINV